MPALKTNSLPTWRPYRLPGFDRAVASGVWLADVRLKGDISSFILDTCKQRADHHRGSRSPLSNGRQICSHREPHWLLMC